MSEILSLYEEEQLPVEESLVAQYLHNDRVVKEFTAYYDLYNKYKKDYRIGEILEGEASPQAIARAKAAAFDERLSLPTLLQSHNFCRRVSFPYSKNALFSNPGN